MKKIDGIPQKMMALVAYGPHNFKYEECNVPEIGEDEILIRSLGCGICAGDTKSYHGAAMFWGDDMQPRWQIPPVRTGHEFAGEIVAIGDDAAEKYNLELGDWCVPEQIIPCGKCRYCKEGVRWMCEVHDLYGFQSGISDGGMADYVRINSRSTVYKLPKSIGIKGAVMIEPVACAAHTVERACISMRDVVVIGGLGPIGLCKLQFAKMKSPKMLIAIDCKANRLEMAKKFGADVAINFLEEDPVAKVKELTGGYGCDIYIENAGHPSSVINGLNMLRKHGKMVEFSVFSEPTTVDWSIIGDRKEMTIIGSHIGGLEGYEIAINAIVNKSINFEDIVTHVFPLEDWKMAFGMAEKGDESIKIALIPEASK